MMDLSATYPRYSSTLVLEAIEDSPVILLHGPRQCGKTTLAWQVAEAVDYHYISFDDDSQRSAALADPTGYIANLPEYVILDEIQRVPTLFTAIKSSVDNDRRPGRFILTGSANVLLLPTLADSLAGRMEIVRLRPLAQTELARNEPSLLAQIFDGSITDHRSFRQYSRLGEQLANIIAAGGYPAAIKRATERRRNNWYRDYITTILQRDVQDLARIHNLDILPRLLSAAAGQTARLFNSADLASPFSVSRPTIREYLTLLEQIFLIEHLQPWHNNRLSRLIKTPKLHLADTGLACALLGVNAQSLWKDKTLLGQMLETFVYQELRKHADWHDQALNFFHFRNKDKVEVDIVIEQGRKILGVEVKAAATVTASDFKGLTKLRGACDEHFVCGIVFYDGESTLSFGDRLLAMPIRCLLQSY